ncbi:SGNH hydrolase [Acephala macrosclerotiorum]|nr:SGNH hydrolase [Acephala macrosclerotiorum]
MNITLLLYLTLISMTLASPLSTPERNNKPAAFFLEGDSATAALSGTIGTNFGHNGATTVSFVSGGDWAKVLASVTRYKSTYSPFSFANTSQFGHNDQKATANISIPAFSTNLKNMAQDRRKYASTRLIKPDLTDVVNAALSVASANGFPFIDLNKASMAYLNAVGEADARLYDRVAGDATHLNAAGDMLFGNMVSWLLEGSGIDTQVEGFSSPNVLLWTILRVGNLFSL